MKKVGIITQNGLETIPRYSVQINIHVLGEQSSLSIESLALENIMVFRSKASITDTTERGLPESHLEKTTLSRHT